MAKRTVIKTTKDIQKAANNPGPRGYERITPPAPPPPSPDLQALREFHHKIGQQIDTTVMNMAHAYEIFANIRTLHGICARKLSPGTAASPWIEPQTTGPVPPPAGVPKVPQEIVLSDLEMPVDELPLDPDAESFEADPEQKDE